MTSYDTKATADAVLQQGLADYQSGRLSDALISFDRAIHLRPDGPVGHFYRGLALQELKRFQDALASYDHAIRLQNAFPEAYVNRGNTLQELNRLDEAVASYDRAIALKPDFPAAYSNRGNALKRLCRPEEALASYDRAIALKPAYADAYVNRGNLLQELNRLDDAVAAYNHAIALTPDNAVAYGNRGFVLHNLKRFQDALASYDRAIVLNPTYEDAYNNRGNALQELLRLDDAIANYDRAIALKPDFPAAHNNRGNALKRLLRMEEALASYDRAIALKPDYAEVFFNKAAELVDLKRVSEALASYDRAIALKPDYAEAHWAKSNLLLLLGDYKQGWKLHEWRFKGEHYKNANRNFHRPRWSGEPKTSPLERADTLLIHAEAGFGDAIQYCRYVPLLAVRNVEVILEVPSSLVALMTTLEGSPRVVESNRSLPDFDQYCPIGSLPMAFGTTLETIPARFPYLYADRDKQTMWQKRLGETRKPRIGLVWSGNPDRQIDLNPAKNRSIPLHLLKPLLQLPFEFHSLQKDARASDAATLAEIEALHDHSDDLNNFSDTAALITQLDLVITIDTSVAHVAGALGHKVWVLLPSTTDYRWGMTGATTPWYPTATLFRQSTLGDWESVVSEVAAQLSSFK